MSDLLNRLLLIGGIVLAVLAVGLIGGWFVSVLTAGPEVWLLMFIIGLLWTGARAA